MTRPTGITTVMICCLAGAAAPLLLHAQDSSDDEAAVRKAVASYVEAFNKGDAEAVAAHWSEDGEFSAPSGKTIKGRAALQEAFGAYFAENKGVQIEIVDPEIQFLSPNVAVEEGSSRVISPDQEPEVSDYVAVHVRHHGAWKMDSVADSDRPQPRSHYEKLKELEWMIGEWVDQDDNSTIETVCAWTKNRNFITRSFNVQIDGRVEIEGTQVIGWDASRETIRSWVFDSDGGFGVGAWSRQGDRWTVRALRVLGDGSKGSANNTYTYVDENTFTFRSTGREMDGELLPNIAEIAVVRK